MGLANYYRFFVPGFSKIAAPLNAYPLPDSTDGTPTEELVAALTTVGGDSSVEESTLAILQREDTELGPMIDYLQTGTLPQNDKEVKRYNRTREDQSGM